MHRLFTRGPKRHMGWCATVTTDGNISSFNDLKKISTSDSAASIIGAQRGPRRLTLSALFDGWLDR